MKQKKSLLALASLLFVTGLASCNGNGGSKDVSSITKGFSSSVDGTVSLTYTAQYKVDINANGGSANLDSFKRDVVSTTTADVDFTASSLYLKITNTTKDKLNNTESKSEALVFKSTDGKYYYETNRTAAPVELKDSEVSTKISQLLASASSTQVGGIDSGTFLYKTDMSYELAQFGRTDTFEKDELNESTYEANDKGGIKVTYAPSYVGYNTDNGVSDFKNYKDATKAAANIVLNTNEKGYVLDYTETYTDTGLDMPVVTPAPTVMITGSRKFTATYGGEITKASSIALNTDTAYITVTRDTNIASVSGKEFILTGATPGSMTDITFTNNEGKVTVATNKWVALTPKPLTGFKVKSVTVNGTAATYMQGMYCFKAEAAGEYAVDVVSEADTETEVKYVTVTFDTSDEHVTAMTGTYFDVSSPQTQNQLVDGNKVPVGYWLGVKVTCAEGYEVDAVTAGDKNVTAMAGYYCINCTAEGAITVKATSKATAA